jgi:hypothetical protein
MNAQCQDTHGRHLEGQKSGWHTLSLKQEDNGESHCQNSPPENGGEATSARQIEIAEGDKIAE